MFGMARTFTRCILAAVLIAAHVPLGAHIPLPAASGRGGAHAGPMACCAPKACCDGMHACSTGGSCGMMGASHAARHSGGVGPQMFARNCGDETPRVTPLQLDPTVAPRIVVCVPLPSVIPALPASDVSCISLAARPLVPPPRA
jgi:hypothetical protein